MQRQNKNRIGENFLISFNVLYEEKLHLSNISIFDFEKATFNIRYLMSLSLSSNFSNELFAEIQNNFLTLDLSNNQLSLPHTLKGFFQLTNLNIAHNHFANIPKVLSYGIQMLKFLNMSFNKITKFNDLPTCISSITNLNISNNNLAEVPKWVFNSICNLEC